MPLLQLACVCDLSLVYIGMNGNSISIHAVTLEKFSCGSDNYQNFLSQSTYTTEDQHQQEYQKKLYGLDLYFPHLQFGICPCHNLTANIYSELLLGRYYYKKTSLYH